MSGAANQRGPGDGAGVLEDLDARAHLGREEPLQTALMCGEEVGDLFGSARLVLHGGPLALGVAGVGSALWRLLPPERESGG